MSAPTQPRRQGIILPSLAFLISLAPILTMAVSLVWLLLTVE